MVPYGGALLYLSQANFSNSIFKLDLRRRAKVKAERRLSDKQKRYCQEYVANGGDKKAAYLAAGYSPDNTNLYGIISKLMDDSRVQKYIRELTVAANSAANKGIADITKIAEIVDEEGKAAATIAKNDSWFSAMIARRNERLYRLSLIARQEAEEEVLIKGVAVKRKASIRDAIRAMELIAKMEGELQEKRELQDDMIITVGMVDEEEDAEYTSEDQDGDNQQDIQAVSE